VVREADGLIDLRSDTVTKPTPAMRRAMAEAEVGDDVLGDDPTVQRLQEAAAARVGKEAALFVPSGVMANLVSLMTLTGRNEEVIVGDQSHLYTSEVGGLGIFGERVFACAAEPARRNHPAGAAAGRDSRRTSTPPKRA
jgi:threonine aldolase